MPSDQNSDKQRLFLYLVEQETTAHFHVIRNINAFTSFSKFCQNYLKPYNKKHQCTISCFVCDRQNCYASENEMSCRNCHFTCKSLSCFEHHKKTTDRRKKSSCERWWKCTVCKKTIDRKQQNVEEHTCDTYFCKCCQKIADIHIRSSIAKEHLPRYIFFECKQGGDAIQCEEGYHPSVEENCTLCKELKSTCTKCSVCKNCHRADCGKKTHAPNLVVARSVCERCIYDNDSSPESKCDYCGNRCSKCNKFDKESDSYEQVPCQDK